MKLKLKAVPGGHDQATRLLVIDLLANEAIGGPAALKVLRQLGQNPPATSKAFADPVTRRRAAEKARARQDLEAAILRILRV